LRSDWFDNERVENRLQPRLLLILLVLTLVSVCSGWAQIDSRLAALDETLRSLHNQTNVSAVSLGGGPKLTLAKHQLRDWVESQLDAIEKEGDEAKASERINKSLENIGVTRTVRIYSAPLEMSILGGNRVF
jgi:hypothetical protein